MKIVNIILGLGVFLLLVVLALIFALQQPRVLEYAVKKAVSKEAAIKLHEFKIGHCAVNWKAVYLSDINAYLEHEGHEYKINGLNLQFFVNQHAGRFDALDAMVDKNPLTEIKGNFVLNKDTLDISQAKAFYAKGILHAKAQYHLLNNTYVANINLQDIDLSNPAAADGIFKKISHVGGALDLSGDKKGLKKIDGNFLADKGGDLSSKVLDFLTDQNTNLKQLFIDQDSLHFDTAKVTISSLSLEKIRLDVKIKSKILNLNADIDVNLEGGLESALQKIQSILIGGNL